MDLVKRLLVCVSLMLCGSAQAGVVYDEAASGDLANNDSIVFNLLSGVNSVLGSVYFYSDQATGVSTADFDGFTIHLDAGQTLLSVGLIISFTDYKTTTLGIEEGYSLMVGGYLGYDGFVASDGSGVSKNIFQTLLPVTGSGDIGVHSVGKGLSAYPNNQIVGAAWDYEFRFTVVGGAVGVNDIPEPTTFMLFGFGLAGLWVRKHGAIVG